MERGRPRTFDVGDALEAALRVFWRDGFRGASMSELTEAMGISKPSLYAAFGDKESLYLKALDRYGERMQAAHERALEAEPDVRRAIEGSLSSMVRAMTERDKAAGCMAVTGCADCGTPGMPASVEEALRRAVRASADRFEARLRRGVADGQLPPGTDVRALAELFSTLGAGIAVQARAGSSRRTLLAVVRAAMSALPG